MARKGGEPPSIDGDITQVDAFIVENRLDAGAAQAMRREPLDVQQAVMARGSLAVCE